MSDTITPADPKNFSIQAIVSITDGRLFCEFQEVHELIEYLAGHPVWTHAIPGFADPCRNALIQQHPSLEGILWDPADEKIEDFIQEIARVWGPELPVVPMQRNSSISG